MAIDIWKSPNSCFGYQTFAAGYTTVFIIPSAKLISDTTLVQVLCAWPGIDRNIGEAWIGHQGAGDPYDFDGNQVQLKVGASASWIVDQDGIWTDAVAFALDKTKILLIAAYLPTVPGMARSLCHDSGYLIYYTAGNDAATTDKTGYDGPTWTDYITLWQQITGPSAYKLSGTIKEKGSPVARTVRSFTRSTGELFSSGASAANGIFSIDAPNDTEEMFVVAFDDDAGDQYNALVYDRVKGVAA